MIPKHTNPSETPFVSIGIFAWNEERAISAMLASLFQQSLFERLCRRGLACEVICVTNGCTDRTASVAEEVFAQQRHKHSWAEGFAGRVAAIQERGKVNAWNRFVHEFSVRQAKYLFMMDADILIHRPETLWNMVQSLEQNPAASVAVDRPRKDIFFKQQRSWRDWFSLRISEVTLAASAQLCAQLYCIRAEVARGLYLPKDLPACEDGFIKSLVCTDNLAHETLPERICLAPEAEHTFEAYTSPAAILRNQKRQVIGQTIVHLLVDKNLRQLPGFQRRQLAQTLRARDATDPDWLKRLISQHLQRTRWFWRLYPGLFEYRLTRLRGLNPLKQIICLPAACASCCATLLASLLAYRTLKSGSIHYWPKERRLGLGGVHSADLRLRPMN
ncbi:MAG TPA: glycosyltransferase [Candidatus Limnocylindrales bacterium]|jgi:hypothetical protein|nr:glycosyltransferase [Candidatus Limnocylindrales bacterium]